MRHFILDCELQIVACGFPPAFLGHLVAARCNAAECDHNSGRAQRTRGTAAPRPPACHNPGTAPPRASSPATWLAEKPAPPLAIGAWLLAISVSLAAPYQTV
jgi:hypothetical protein